MNVRRASGILLHPTSLPGPFGVGDLGPEAYQFVRLLHSAKQSLWQVLPLGPAGKGNSPYNCLSAFAGNPLLISPQKLVEHGYLKVSDIKQWPCFGASGIEYPRAKKLKEDLLRKAHQRFQTTADYRLFEENNAGWLEPFAEFMSRKDSCNGVSWTQFSLRRPANREEMRFHKFVQYEFFRQWSELKSFCNSLGISIIGDLPFYVEHDSADVWAHRELFHLDSAGNPSIVGGVPPDYFSATGQLWGNPTYNWERLQATGYKWWLDRLRMVLSQCDLVRLDHFRGYEAAWAVASCAPTAVEGRWVEGPGEDLFQCAQKQLGCLPIIAENLGVITPRVEEIRLQFSFLGMAVLQFGFSGDSTHRPHNFTRDTLACTGTHDNDTILGWWNALRQSPGLLDSMELPAESGRALEYLGTEGCDVNWAFIRAVMTSVADLAVFPMQDVLGLGREARMNIPGKANGNWEWRYQPGPDTKLAFEKLKTLTELTERFPGQDKAH